MLIAGVVVLAGLIAPQSANSSVTPASTFSVFGHTYDANILRLGRPYVHFDGSNLVVDSIAQQVLSSADFSALSRFAADSNAAASLASAALARTSSKVSAIAAQRAASPTVAASSTCKINLLDRESDSTWYFVLQVPDCMMNAVAGLQASLGALVGTVAKLLGVTLAVAASILGVFEAAAAAILVYKFTCDIFGPGNGVEPWYPEQGGGIQLHCF
jgi:hypothetical protein